MPRAKLLTPNYRLRLRGRIWYVVWTDIVTGHTREFSTRSEDWEGAERMLVRRRNGWEPEPSKKLPPSKLVRERVAKLLYDRAKYRASVRNEKISLSLDDVRELLDLSKGRCAVTGARLDFTKRKREKGRRPWVPSLDRIDATKGYTRENSRIVCWAANAAMGAWGEPVFTALLNAYERSIADGFLK